MKNHLKKIAVPSTWVIDKKRNTFVSRPLPGAHKFEYGLPLGLVLRDFLKLSSTMSETKKLLNNNEVLIDGKRKKDHRQIIGLFDVLKIPQFKKSYRVIFNKKGKLIVTEINEKESGFKLCKILGKTVIRGGKVQFNLHDGKNIVSDVKANVGETLVLSLPKLEVQDVLPLEEGVAIYLMKGKNRGNTGSFKGFKNNEAIYMVDGEEITTAKAYLFVVGKDRSMIGFK